MSVADIPVDDAPAVAEAAGLHYADDESPGITRRRRGTGFSYVTPGGATLGGAERERIEMLAIPPAWSEVWISPNPDNHLLATGRDDRGRKQYLYHERWREVRDLQKFLLLDEFAHQLVEMRRAVAADISGRGLTRARVTAAVVRLLDTTLIRVGSERYAADNDTYGATTLEPRHVRRTGTTVELSFTGKGEVERFLTVSDREVATVVAECADQAQPQLFCFADGQGGVSDLTAEHVNEYLTALAGTVASAKTFRTWGGSVVAAHALASGEHGADGEVDPKLAAVDRAAEALGNTRAVCRACYVAPQVLDAFDSGAIDEAWGSSRNGRWRSRAESTVAKLF